MRYWLRTAHVLALDEFLIDVYVTFDQAMHSSQNPTASCDWVYRKPFKLVHLRAAVPMGGGVSGRHVQATKHQGDGEGHSQLGEELDVLLRPFLQASLPCHRAYLVQ